MTTELLEMVAVSTIQHGTVIDHISAGNALKIVSLLDVTDLKREMTIGIRLRSESLGHKDILKIADWYPEEHLNQVALFAPHATINIIRDYQVAEKYKVVLPREMPINKPFCCNNPRCITKVEIVHGNFQVIKYQRLVKLLCTYCGKDTPLSEVHYAQN